MPTGEQYWNKRMETVSLKVLVTPRLSIRKAVKLCKSKSEPLNLVLSFYFF